MMQQYYLIFDTHCSVCNQLAKTIQTTVGDKLEGLSIYDAQAKRLLDQAYPEGWEHAPYFIIVDEDKVQAWKGFMAALWLGWLMGPRKAWRIWALARRYGVLLPFNIRKPYSSVPGRRQFLAKSLGIGLAVVAARLFNHSIFKPRDAYAAPCDCTPPCFCTHVDTQTSCICYCHNCNVCPARSDYEVRNICLCSGSPCNGYWHCVTVYCNSGQCIEQCA